MTPTSPKHRRAVIIGGGMAGMLAAAALADHAEKVTVIERDQLPNSPIPRKGLPQARHVHVLYSGGARAFESLLPGVTERWLEAGARRIPLPTGLVSYTAQGWLRRWSEMQFMIACTRDLLDLVVRDRVMDQHPHVTLLQEHELLRLNGTADRVTGVRVLGPDGQEAHHEADLVVDASGRGSRAPHWLTDLGIPTIEEAEVDSGLVYASRLYRAPAGSESFPLVNVQSDPNTPVPGQTATIEPVEGGRWLVTLSGTRGGEPTNNPDEFEKFARSIRHPVVGELISTTTPLDQTVTVTRSTVNRRRYFEKAKSWPDGFVVIGDAVATYNPLYGQGMSVAAQGLIKLRNEVRLQGLAAHGLARAAQRALAGPAAMAWELATSQDILYPGAVGQPPRAGAGVATRYVNRLMRTATGRPAVCAAFLDVITLSKPATAWGHPDTVVASLRGPGRRPLTEPPLTDAEWAIATGNSDDPTPVGVPKG
ncbi:FAD-dependent oxidoreductase [Streptomyces sp. NBC_00306]|uniref:FAD-dependent oxidoreductase n=1 Tax=Streptomyces sp. NBC_00306 TaxID=2975708 RepID=UPI002E2A1C24|nr:FAD-binding protein [Streptomyces sp. NBC_00306]